MAKTNRRAGTKGDLLVRLTGVQAEIEAAQRLRYRVFYEELAATADSLSAARRIDADRFDAFCDHLIVVRSGVPEGPHPIMVEGGELVGTYRLLRQDVAARHGGFYTEQEYDLAPLLARHRQHRFLELGRSCVLKPYRTRPALELLWQGIWNYVRSNGLDVMFGCASFEGSDPGAHAAALTFLARKYAAPADWKVQALPERYVEMNRGAIASDPRQILKSLPPLIKGYLRLGCYIGEGAVIDSQFNTIDVLIILPISAINQRYFARFGEPNVG